MQAPNTSGAGRRSGAVPRHQEQMSASLNRTSLSPVLWVLLAALVGFASSAIFSSWLHWRRGAFVFGYAALVGLFLAVYFSTLEVRPLVQLRRHWRAGLPGGLVLSAVLAHGIGAQPPAGRPAGAALAWALVWLGGAYCVLDALLLTVFPVLSV
jgi:hypothetical protein